ncbi:MAG: alpha-2-macroglobulin family protein, partial [Bacteroidia bacterium]
NRPLFLVLQTYTDTLNRYVQSVRGQISSWSLAPDHYRLQAYFADSLCVQYDSILIKADSIWVWSLDQVQGDTLAKNHWQSLEDLKPNTEYHQAWSEPVKINYSNDGLGKHGIRFRLVDAFGKAVSGAKVWTQENRNSRRLQISDAQGWVEFGHLSNPTPEISLYHPDFRYDIFEYEEDSLHTLISMPEEHLAKWQAALNAPHKIERTYYNSEYRKLSYLADSLPYIPNLALFYQDTINPVLRSFSLDKEMLPLTKTAPIPVEVKGGFPDFWLPKTGAQWGISSSWGLAQMSGILNYEKGGFGDIGLWYQFRSRLRISLVAGLESQYASAQRGPTIIQENSLWEEWYEDGAAIYPAIRRDRWTSALQLQFTALQNPRWRLELGLGAGLMGGRLLVDARRDAQLYDYQEIFALDQGSPPLSNPDRIDILRGIRDEDYETIYPLQKQIAPYALTSAQISYNLAPRLQIYASYQLQLSGRNTWDTEIGSYDPLSQGPGLILGRRWHQQFGIGLNLKLNRSSQSLWWQNPVTGYYGELTETRELANSMTEDSDGDGVPDLYNKEVAYSFSSPGKSVNGAGRAMDSDYDGVPDLYDKEPNSPEGMYYDAKGVAIVYADSVNALLSEESLQTMNEDIIATLRQDFRDAAFWEPTLRTNANGEARFSIQYPDDITAWHCYVLAMNENRQSGYRKDTVMAQAPLLARLDLPQTLRVGDQIDVVGRVQSLADKSQQIYTRFLLGDSLFEERSVLLDEYWTESQSLSPADTGTYQIAYVLRDSSGFTEGELRELAVIDNKVMEQKGSFVYLEGDSSISMPSGFAASQNVQLIAYHQPIDFLQERLDWLYRYPHGCNEQLASRLIGIHLQQLITTDPTILRQLKQRQSQTLRKLIKSQNANGSWGWWSANQGEEWMSLYVLQTLQTISPNEKAIINGQAWLVEAFREAVKKEKTPSLKLALYLLENQLIAREDYQLPAVDSFAPPLSVFEQVLRLAIQYEQGEEIAVAEILGLAKRDALGGRYWSEKGWRWYGSQIECTALAYELIEKIAPNHAALGQIRQFLLLANDAWQNQTVETARMLQILIKEQDLENAAALQSSPKLQLSYAGDSRLYDDFPLQLDVPPTGVNIRKQGAGPLLLSFSQTQALVDAPEVDSLFEIKTTLVQSGQVLDSLVKSEQLELVVEVVVRYRADHLMLEVPIPAGCTYSNKPQPYGEAYREYRRDRTNIYLRSLAPGKYTYRIPLESRFTGDFQLLPAQMELMYVPTQFGRNASKRVKIID